MKKLYFTDDEQKEAKKIWNKRYYIKNREKLKAQQLINYHKKKNYPQLNLNDPRRILILETGVFSGS